MKILDLSWKIYNSIVFENVPFSLALKKAWKYENIDRGVRSDITAIVGCALRHYFVFNKIILDNFSNLDNDSYGLISVCFANDRFLNKPLESNERILFLNNLSDENKDKYIKLVDFYKDKLSLIPDSLDKNTLEYLSYRYNTPLWLIKMWNKHFGLNALYKILKANSKPAKTYVKKIINCPLNESNYVRINENLYEYIGNNLLKKSDEYINKLVFPYNNSYDSILNEIDVDPVRGIAIFAGFQNNVLLDLVSRTSKYLKLDMISNNTQTIYDNKAIINNYSLENVRLYDCEPSSTLTCISSKVHTFIVMPNNSRFSLLKTAPDYFLRISPDKLDGFINEQKIALEECSNLIEDGGQLVYFVNTLNNKECHGQIEQFLMNHPDFSMIEEKQFFGIIDSESALYACILEKNNSND